MRRNEPMSGKNVRVAIMTLPALLLSVAEARSAGIQVARPLPGYTCEQLDLTEEQARDITLQVIAREAPSRLAPIVGYVSMTVAVRTPEHRVNGFVEALWPTGRTVWIPADVLQPYHSLSEPATRCVPAVMTSGNIGFDYKR